MSIPTSESGKEIDFSPLQFSITSQDLFDLFVSQSETHTYGSLSQLEKLGGKKQLLKELRVTTSKGLPFESKLDHNSRLSAFGSNELPKPKMKSFLHFVKEQFRQFCIQVLLICSILVFGIAFLKRENRRAETFSEAGILFLAVAFVVIIGSVTDYSKEKEFQQLLLNQFTPTCTCLRSGTQLQIPSTKLLVGDIIILQQGDHVFADCLFIEGQFLMVDQSQLTGETELVQKTPVLDSNQNDNNNNYMNNDPFILSGCNIMEGSGKLIVCGVGINTQTGALRKQIDNQEFFESLILAEDVNNLAKLLIIIGGILALTMFTILLISLIIHVIEYKQNFFSEATMLILVKIFMESFLVLVLSVPEGLPMIFTLSLAYAVHSMQKQNIVFRKLNACDAMGGCTDLIFDKTGTLSKGKLTVNKIFLYNQTLEKFESPEFKLIFSEFAEIIALSCQQQQQNNEDQSQQRDSLKALNSNITQTVIKFLAEQTYNYNNIIETYENKIIENIPQQLKTDYNAVILKITDSQFRCIFKGSPQFIIKHSKYIRIGTQSMQLSTFSSQHKEFLLNEIIQNFSENCIQIIGFGYIDYSDEAKTIQQMLGQLTFLGLVGIHEEYRDNIDQLFEKILNDVKICPRIITGDQYLISYKLLNRCRLLSNEQIVHKEQTLVLSGQQFMDKLQQQQSQQQFLQKILLIYRATADQKQELVTKLIKNGRIVCYIGDGINDAQALKAADVSICMGVNAAQIAQENSSVILQDDNLENLIVMLQWGRTIYENIQRFIWYQLTFCIVSIFYMLYASLTVGESPFSIVQIIWLSLIHDVFSSLALATEKPSKNVFKTRTFKRNEYIISIYVFIMIGLQIVYQLTVLLTLHAIYMKTKEHKSEWTAIEKWKEREHIPNTILFACLGWLQITSLICSRRIQKNEYNIFENITSNQNFMILIGFVICVQCIILFFGGRFFEIAGLDVPSHLLCLALGVGSYVWFICSKQLIIIGENIIMQQKKKDESQNNYLIEGLPNEGGEFFEEAELIAKI